MAKVIKFNITVDGVSIRTIEELIEHFNISDIVELYESGTLLRWLQAREYSDYAEKIQQIDSAAPLEEKVTALCSAFGFSCGNIEQAVSDLLHTKRREAALKEYAQDAASVDKIIANYLADYEKLKNDLKAHASDESFIQSAVEQLVSVYQAAVQHDCKRFYKELRDSKENYSLITKHFRLNKTTRAYLYPTNSIVQTSLSTGFFKLIANMMEDYSTNLAALKKAADKIAEHYMPEFEQQWERLFNEIKDAYPLMFYALCMNKKINTFIFKNIQDCDKYNDFLHPTDNICQRCEPYLKSVTSRKGSSHYISVSSILSSIGRQDILVVFFRNAEIMEEFDSDDVRQKINKFDNNYLQQNEWVNQDGTRASFLLFHSLSYAFRKGGGEILYMEVPETYQTVQEQTQQKKEMNSTKTEWNALQSFFS